MAFTGAVFLFQKVDASVTAAQERLSGVSKSGENVVVEQAPVYGGVADPWIESGSFTVGSEELDQEIKKLCDANTSQGDTAEEAARQTFNAVADSVYIDIYEKPSGIDWVARSAKAYFESVKTEGTYAGDYYEFASVIALCLRYFGMSDAIAVPVLFDTQSGAEYGTAVCLVSDSNGVGRVCDPSQGPDGWMLPRTSYSILVDDIGQNLDPVLGLGLKVKEKEQQRVNGNGYDAEGGNGTGYDESGMSSYDNGEYGTGSGNSGYDTGTSTSSSGGTSTGTSTSSSTSNSYGGTSSSATNGTSSYDDSSYV